MDNKIKSTRANKRELVMPFSGEENLVVPKKGGFGQPDNDRYVYLTTPTSTSNLPDGNTQTSADTGINTGSIDTGGTGASSGTTLGGSSGGGATSSGTHVSPITIATQQQTQQQATENQAPTQQVGSLGTPAETTTTTTSTSSFPTTTTTPPRTDTTLVDTSTSTSTSSGGALAETSTTPPKVVSETTIPTFPDYNTMDCKSLEIEITSLKSTIATGTFAIEVADAYNNALQTAQNVFTTKCNVPTNDTPIAIIPTTGGVGGGFGGGGGGGLGDEPTNAPIEEEAPKSSYGWLWIVAIIGGLYFLTKKSNKS